MFSRPTLALAVALAALPALAQTPPLGSLTLVEAERLMVEKNRELVAARRAVEIAKADTLSAGAVPNPQLSLATTNINPSQGIGAGPPRSKTVDTVIRVDQLIERGGKRGLRIDTAQKLEAATAAALDDALRQQRLAVAGAYFDVVLAQDKVAIAAENAGLFGKTLEATELRLKAGDVAAADVARIRVDALRAQNDARTAQAEQTRAQLTLAYLIGEEGQARAIRAADDWPPLDGRSPRAINADVIDARPDVRAAQMRVDAASASRELARALRTRDVTVGLQYEHWPVSPTNEQGTGNSWGVAVSIPIFAWYHYQGEIARAEAELAGAQDNLERSRAQARTELEQARADLEAAAERARRYELSLLVEAKKSADYAEFAYKSGAIGVLDLLDSRRTLRALQFEAAGARADYAKALAAWRAGVHE